MSFKGTPAPIEVAQAAAQAKRKALRAEQAEAFAKFINDSVREKRKLPTRKEIAKHMRDVGYYNFVESTVTTMEAVSGINLSVLRMQQGGHVNKTEENADALASMTDGKDHLDWHPLQLFDKLWETFKDGFAATRGTDRDKRVTWLAWRVFLAAAFGLPYTYVDRDWAVEDGSPLASLPAYPSIKSNVPRGAAAIPDGATTQQIYEACTGRTVWPAAQADVVTLVVGRRGGKSYITAIIGIFLAICRKYPLNRGTKGLVMILAKDKDQAGIIRNYVRELIDGLPELRILLKTDPTKKSIEFVNNVVIEVKAISDASTRGYTVVGVLADEVAFWPTDENSAQQDKRVFRALRPSTLSDDDDETEGIIANSGAMIVMLSSPYARRGELYEKWRQGYGKNDEQRLFVWQADTISMRPSNGQKFLATIKGEYEDDPENARAEYGGLFRTDVEALFDRASLEAVSSDANERPYNPAHAYRAFVDPSGGKSDSFVFVVGHDEERLIGKERQLVAIIDLIKEWKPPFDPQEVVREIAQLCRAYRIDLVIGDAYGGEWVRDPFRKAGIGYQLSELNRSELYLEMLPMVMGKLCVLLSAGYWWRLINQFTNLERRVGRSGRDAVNHPIGGHDDLANAVAGVLVSRGVVPFTYADSYDIGLDRQTMRPWHTF